jgi:hypothetical protein
MGKSGEKFMQMREEELLGIEHIGDEYTYKEWIHNLKTPRVIAIGKNEEGFVCFISGDSPQEVYDLAKEHKVLNGLELTIPQKHIFKE